MKSDLEEMSIDEARLSAADPDGLYLFMLGEYPYMMTPDHGCRLHGHDEPGDQEALEQGATSRAVVSASSGLCRSSAFSTISTRIAVRRKAKKMKKLRCDRPYDIDEARKKKGLPRRKRADSRATAYELTIRIPEEYRTYFGNKKKLTRTVYTLNRKEDLKSQVEAFEEEKNAELERRLEEHGWIRQGEGKSEPGRCMTPLGSYANRYTEIRSNGSVSKDTIRNEQRYLRYVDATIGMIPICRVTSEDIEGCLLKVPELSEQWALERQAAWEKNRKTARWAKKHETLVKPLKPIKVAGPDMQAKVLKFLLRGHELRAREGGHPEERGEGQVPHSHVQKGEAAYRSAHGRRCGKVSPGSREAVLRISEGLPSAPAQHGHEA